ncbi:hypothetical protein ABEU20_000276, partial [Rhodococcus sp. PAM 2766]
WGPSAFPYPSVPGMSWRVAPDNPAPASLQFFGFTYGMPGGVSVDSMTSSARYSGRMFVSAEVIDVLDPMPRLVHAGKTGGRSTFAFWRDGAARLLDDGLAQHSHRKLPLADDACVLAASNLDLLVLTSAGGLVIAGVDVVTVPGLPADAAALLGGLLVVAVPEGERHRLLTLEAATGAIRDEPTIDAEDAHAFLHPIRPTAQRFSNSPWGRMVFSHSVSMSRKRACV